MAEKTIEIQIQEINKKLDFLTEQMLEQSKKQREMQELKNDLTLIGKDVFDAAVTELEDIAPYFDTKDLVHLLKKLLRNTKNLTRLLNQVESAEDLYRDLQPLGKQVFDEVLATLNELDQKGYFEFMKESFQILDTIVTSFSVEDVRMLRENITTILLTVKGMTQPEMLNAANNALQFFRKMDIEVEEKTSLMSIIKKMNDPEVKRGMVYMLEFVKNMAHTNDNLQIPINK